MSDMNGAGLAQLVQEIKIASANIRTADDETRQQIRAIEQSVNDLYRKVGRPGGYVDDNETEARKSAIGLCQIHKSLVAEGDATDTTTPHGPAHPDGARRPGRVRAPPDRCPHQRRAASARRPMVCCLAGRAS